MKKNLARNLVLACCALFISAAPVFAQTYSASQIKNQAFSLEDVGSAISYINENLSKCATQADRRSVLYLRGMLQEQYMSFGEASASYAQAAGISAGDAAGMPKVSTEQLVLCAVRCSLNAGDWESAANYLGSAVKNSKNANIQAYVKLYSIWVELVKATSYAQVGSSVLLLKSYSQDAEMKCVRPQVLFSLWYLTGSGEWADVLKASYASSPEYLIVKGKVRLENTPMWLFVPRYCSDTFADLGASSSSSTSASTGSSSASAGGSSVGGGSSSGSSSAASSASTKKSGKLQQLGLFRSEDNAIALMKKAKASGFDASYYAETRSSGTTYYIVVVSENSDGTMGKKLREAGFDCCPIEL